MATEMLCYRAGFAADSRGDDVSHSIYNTKLLIKMLLDKFNTEEYSVYLTSANPSDNFRNLITDNYKANRKKQCVSCVSEEREYRFTHTVVRPLDKGFKKYHVCGSCQNEVADTKPIYYTEIRDYLEKKHNAKICEFGEADDWLCTDLQDHEIVVSSDKDLLMCPGNHYRFVSNKLVRSSDVGRLFYSQSKQKMIGFGVKWFFAQLLLGDQIDNIIKPKKGFGDKGVFKLLKPLNTIKSLKDAVVSVYEKEKKLDLLELNAKLLWIARKPKQIFRWEILDELDS